MNKEMKQGVAFLGPGVRGGPHKDQQWAPQGGRKERGKAGKKRSSFYREGKVVNNLSLPSKEACGRQDQRGLGTSEKWKQLETVLWGSTRMMGLSEQH